MTRRTGRTVTVTKDGLLNAFFDALVVVDINDREKMQGCINNYVNRLNHFVTGHNPWFTALCHMRKTVIDRLDLYAQSRPTSWDTYTGNWYANVIVAMHQVSLELFPSKEFHLVQNIIANGCVNKGCWDFVIHLMKTKGEQFGAVMTQHAPKGQDLLDILKYADASGFTQLREHVESQARAYQLPAGNRSVGTSTNDADMNAEMAKLQKELAQAKEEARERTELHHDLYTRYLESLAKIEALEQENKKLKPMDQVQQRQPTFF